MAHGQTRFFTDRDDARRYIGEVSRTWLVWLITLALLLIATQWWALLLVGFAFLTAMAIVGKPLQERAARVEGAEPPAAPSKVATALGRGRGQDRAFRTLLYGEVPLRQAIALTGTTPMLLWLRRLVLVVTIGAFVWVLIALFTPPA